MNFTLNSVTPLLPPFIPPSFDPKNIPFPVAVKDLLIKLTDLIGAQFTRPALSLKKIVGLIPHADTELLNAGVSVDAQSPGGPYPCDAIERWIYRPMSLHGLPIQ